MAAGLPRVAARARFVRAAVVATVLSLWVPAAIAQSSSSSCASPPARAVSVQGTVEVRTAGDTQWRPLSLEAALCAGDTVRVGQRSRADLAMLDQSVLRLNAGTTLTVEQPKEERTGVVDLLRGAAHFFSRGPRSLEVKTPFTIAGVRGTEFLVDVEAERTLLTVFEGVVLAENPAGRLELAGGQSAVAEQGRAPAARVVVRPRDAVAWALFYPPVVYFRPEQFAAGPGPQGLIRASLDAYAQGDLQKAFAELDAIPPEPADPRLLAWRAHLLLAVGRVDEARADVDRALIVAPNDANALALRSLVAVVRDDRAQAMQVAQAAVQAAPDAAAPRVALSYAEQASFDLPAARQSLEKAVALEPENALAWARLAEIHASFGDLDQSLAAAQRAATLAPGLSRTQTVLGYAHLLRIDLAPATTAFERAITLDQADPLPRLGIGLARIRAGRLDQGSRDIEIAASLDPNSALIRSYLGKAYYEEKRSPLDEREYAAAQGLDPRDPTPWFYDAIQKQTTNRPVEALRDLDKAIALNDNRAVYRSQLLLDSDAAARSASVARIYTDLGFEQRALVEGWNSVNTDPTDFSGHRFLSDSYAALPRHEIARVSELLQSQLLQPANTTPLQPRLAESNLFLVSSGGPSVLSFNEFNPLFTRDGLNAQVGGMAGEHGTWGGDFVVAGLSGRTAYSIGYNQFASDGFRVNNDQDDRIAAAFVQHDFTPQTSVQAEYRYRKTEVGDLQQKFFSDVFFPGLRNTQELNTFRVGGRHAFSPGSILLGSVMVQDAKFGTIFDEPGFFTGLRIPQDAYSAELQHLYRASWGNLRSGIGFFDVSGEVDSTLRMDLPPPPDGPGSVEERTVTKTDYHHINAYAYADFKPLPNLLVTAGASVDSLSGDLAGGNDKDQVNPKLGLVWNPMPGTTVRAAAFRALKRTLITDQTLEPTQVAGFNQFFDDFNLTESWRYGVAVDQKLGDSMFAGVELSKRDLTVPYLDAFTDPANPQSKEVDWEEQFARAYFFWAPHRWVALRAEYIFERFDRVEEFSAGVKNLDTHRMPLGVRFFHPSGFVGSLTATFWKQKGEFEQFPEFRSGKDDFWLVDAGIGYRLPQRRGMVSVGVTNLFDQQFNFYDIDAFNVTIQPKRMVFARVTLAFP
jgi:tetratricopeptide (TPR) repeat protein